MIADNNNSNNQDWLFRLDKFISSAFKLTRTIGVSTCCLSLSSRLFYFISSCFHFWRRSKSLTHTEQRRSSNNVDLRLIEKSKNPIVKHNSSSSSSNNNSRYMYLSWVRTRRTYYDHRANSHCIIHMRINRMVSIIARRWSRRHPCRRKLHARLEHRRPWPMTNIVPHYVLVVNKLRKFTLMSAIIHQINLYWYVIRANPVPVI